MLRLIFVMTLPLTLVVSLSGYSWSQLSYANLKDGTVLGPGNVTQVQALSKDQGVNSKKDVSIGTMTCVDDGLRRTFVNSNRILNTTDAGGLFKIDFPGNATRKEDHGQVIESVRAPISTTPFELFGRRFYTINLMNKTVFVVQGITEISPQYVRVESLKTDKNAISWDMRLSLSSIDSDTLGRILVQNVNPTRSGDWIDIVSLFKAAGRFKEAREMLLRAMQKFPELDTNNYRSNLKEFDQSYADQFFAASERHLFFAPFTKTS